MVFLNARPLCGGVARNILRQVSSVSLGHFGCCCFLFIFCVAAAHWMSCRLLEKLHSGSRLIRALLHFCALCSTLISACKHAGKGRGFHMFPETSALSLFFFSNSLTFYLQFLSQAFPVFGQSSNGSQAVWWQVLCLVSHKSAQIEDIPRKHLLDAVPLPRCLTAIDTSVKPSPDINFPHFLCKFLRISTSIPPDTLGWLVFCVRGTPPPPQKLPLWGRCRLNCLLESTCMCLPGTIRARCSFSGMLSP